MSLWKRFVKMINPNGREEPVPIPEETKEELSATAEFPATREGGQASARGHIPTNDAGLRVVFLTAADGAKAFDADRSANPQGPEHPIEIMALAYGLTET